MVKKLKAMADKKKNASASGLFDSALAGSVKESAQQIWLAGMGAFAKAILLDEPFAGIDPIAVIEIQRIIGFLKAPSTNRSGATSA